MTTETKVGLIIGLAFIVLFAVILSNRGAHNDLAPPTMSLLQGEDSAAKLGPGTPAESSPPVHDAAGQTASGSLPQAGRASTAEEPRFLFPGRTENGSPVPVPVGELPASLTTPQAGEPPVRKESGPMLEGFQPFLPPRGPAKREDAEPAVADAGAPKRGEPSVREYEVQPGDSLSKIARQFYGSDKPSLLRALSEANRSQIDSLDRIAAGQKIRIPDVRELVQQVAEPKRTGTQEAPPDATRKLVDRAYVVKDGDTLISIARAQLGRAGRWSEIVDLNQKTLSDPHKIRPGMKLRLPASLADAGRPRSSRP